MTHFRTFLIERLSMGDLVMLYVENNFLPNNFEGKIDKIYSSKYGISSEHRNSTIKYICGPTSWGNKSLDVGKRALMFIHLQDGTFHEHIWKGHMALEEIEGELQSVICMPNKWNMQGIQPEIAESIRTDPRCENHSIIPFRLLEPLLIQLIEEINTLLTLRYHQYWLKCGGCSSESRFPIYEHTAYALMQNPQNGSDYRLVLRSMQSFREVARLTRKFLNLIIEKNVKDSDYKNIMIERHSIEQRCFAHICDPVSGVKYQFDLGTVCPHCQSRNVKGWGPTENPYETIDLEIPYITHYHWDSLQQEEKEKIIHDEVYRLVTEKLKELEKNEKQNGISHSIPTKKLRYHQYWLKCADCEKESRFPVYEHDGYLLMRNPKNEADCRLWDWDDQTSKEVNQLAKKYEAIIITDLVKNPLYKKIIRNSVPIEQKCFSHICDPSNGVKYYLNTEPVCPHCHSHNIKGWGPTENPYETIDLEIPYITHHHWDSLSQEEKEKIIYDEVYRLVTDKLRELESRDVKQ